MKIEEIKRNLNRMVVYRGKPNIYKLTACIIRRNENGFFYQVELLDVKANSVIYCEMEDVTGE